MAASTIQSDEPINLESFQPLNRTTRSNPSLFGHEGHAAITETLDHGTDNEPNGAATDQRPTRKYQILLLLSGFVMCFHTIGINLSYGIFQVSVRIAYMQMDGVKALPTVA